MPKNKRFLREMQRNDPFANAKGTGPIKHVPGSKPARQAKKFQAEIQRKYSKQDLSKAAQHMKEHAG